MKVSDFQKYLRALADAIGSTGKPAKDLEAAAAALTPFAAHSMEAFATFLRLAEAKYGETGELPDGKPPKAAPKPRATKTPAAPKPTAEQFKARVEELKLALDRGEPLSRDQVHAEVMRFKPLTQKAIDAVMADLKFPAKIKGKDDSLEAIVNHIVAARTAADRVKV